MDDLPKILALIGVLAVGSWSWPTTDNLAYVKANAEQKWKSDGFTIQGYDGYNFGSGVGSYGGAKVWYYLKKVPDNGITYAGFLQRWGDEIHTYNISAIDAIKPTH